jgi:hypothetical protein
MKTALISITFLLLASSSLSVPAQAEDTPAVVTAMFKGWEGNFKVKPTYDKLETDSNGNVTITNLVANIEAAGSNPAVKLTIGEIALDDVGDEENGVIEVGSATVTNTKVEVIEGGNKAFEIDVPESSIEEWFLPVGDPSTPQEVFRSSVNIAKKVSSGEFKISAMGQTITSDGYETTWDGDTATGAGKFTLKLSNVVIPEAALASIDTAGQLKALGYGDIRFDASGDAEIKITDDKFGITSNIEYAGKDIGGIKLALAGTDIPLAALSELKKAQKETRPPDMSALMPQLMGVSLGTFQFRFEDASITKKLLPVIARMQGMDEATMVANAGAIMQVGLMQLKNQAFTDQVVGAVNAFLKDPKSITVSLKPAQPVPVQSIMTLNPTDPAAAINLLGVSVTAND